MAETKEGLPVKRFTTQKAFETWMERNHEKTPGIWIKYAKKSSGLKTISYAEALDVALCFGWIDGKAWSLDETFYLQRYTPRRAKSRWSNLNRGHVARLKKEGRMRTAGLREVERAKADGRWDVAYESPKDAKVPSDLEKALKKKRKAWEFFETLNASNRYAIIYQVNDAKKPETRTRRIEKFVKMCAAGEKLY
jgi:uncharacterized protein YdeI (YjbR/CyaY-like superfamily)